MIKELAMLEAYNQMGKFCEVFRTDRSWSSLSNEQRRTYSYQERHLHHLSWNEGNRLYCKEDVLGDIKRAFPQCDTENAVIYVIGEQKMKFLQKEFGEKFHFQQLNCERVRDLPCAPCIVQCPYRAHGREHCAMMKCYRMLTYFLFG